jgi:hypothetical protein
MEIVNSKDVCTCLTKHWKITLLFKDNYNNLYFEVVYFGRDRNFVSFFFKKSIFTSIIHTELLLYSQNVEVIAKKMLTFQTAPKN